MVHEHVEVAIHGVVNRHTECPLYTTKIQASSVESAYSLSTRSLCMTFRMNSLGRKDLDSSFIGCVGMLPGLAFILAPMGDLPPDDNNAASGKANSSTMKGGACRSAGRM